MQLHPIQEITILPGKTRDGTRERFDKITISPGDTLSVVGPTGSGKTALISDIEMFAREDTITKRTILVNGTYPPEDFIRNPAQKPVALITQNTKCLSDMLVSEFLDMHIKSRKIKEEGIVKKTIILANEFTGEEITAGARMTSLSGGQTRSLMIADAIIISDAPIILLDEVENAGIFKERVMSCLKNHQKALIFVTHDPLISLLSGRRIVMKNGGIEKVLEPKDQEKDALAWITGIDATICRMRELIRSGELIRSVCTG